MKRSLTKKFALAAGVVSALALLQPAHALIRSSHSVGFCMDAEGGEVREGVLVKLWACHNRANQQLWLDFGNNPSFTGPDGEGYREAVIRFNDGKHCLDPESVMSVKPLGKCASVMVRNHGLNRYTLQKPGKFGTEARCLAAVPSLANLTAIVNGTPMLFSDCIVTGTMYGTTPSLYSFWTVEQ